MSSEETKKPFYKKWWVIAIAAVVVIGIIAGGGSGGDDSSTAASEEEDSKPEYEYSVSAEDLHAEYKNNGIAAENKYKGKTIKVTGKVQEIRKDIMGTPVIDLEGDNSFIQAVTCEFEDQNVLASISKGSRVSVIGTVDNYTMNIVSLEDCTLE